MDGNDQQSVLSQEELENAIAAFSDADWTRIRKAAAFYQQVCRRSFMSADDLVQEALFRALSGTRKCPKDVGVALFIANTIRSIANGESEKIENIQATISLNDETSSFELSGQDPSPENMLSNKQENQELEQKLINLFADDETAQLMVLGILEGESRAELQALSELDDTQFNSKRRKIRRTINKASQNGFKL